MRYPASSGAVLGSSVVRQCGVLGARCDTRQDRRACRLFLGTRDRGRVPRKQVGIGRFPLGSEGGQKRGRLWRLLFSLSFLLSLSLLFSHPLLFSSSFLFSFFLPGPPGPGRAREGPRRREEGTGPCRRRQFSEDGGVFGGDEVFGGLGGFPRTGGVFGGRGGFRRKGRFSEEGEVFGGGGGFSEEGERGGGGGFLRRSGEAFGGGGRFGRKTFSEEGGVRRRGAISEEGEVFGGRGGFWRRGSFQRVGEERGVF